MVTLEQIQQAFGRPLEAWRGKCHEVAAVAASLIEGATVARGYYRGPHRDLPPVAGLTVFSPHGWVVLSDGRVLDPTRWTMDGQVPYLYVGDGADYVPPEHVLPG